MSIGGWRDGLGLRAHTGLDQFPAPLSGGLEAPGASSLMDSMQFSLFYMHLHSHVRARTHAHTHTLTHLTNKIKNCPFERYAYRF